MHKVNYRAGYNKKMLYQWDKKHNLFPPRFPIRKWEKEKAKKYYAYVEVCLSDRELDLNNVYICEYWYLYKRDGEFSFEHNFKGRGRRNWEV